MKVLHLLGATEDNGGILSTIRGLSSAGANLGLEHAVWVHQNFVEVRSPSLRYLRSRHALDESFNHFQLAYRAWKSSGELMSQLADEPFDVLHAHSRGSFLVALIVAYRLRRHVLFTNHTYANRQGMYRWGAARKRLRTVLLTPRMAQHYGLTPEMNRIDLIPECCADRCFELPLRSDIHSSQKPVRLIGVGNLVRWKKWDLLIRALANLSADRRRQIILEIWGPIPNQPDALVYARELQQLIQSHHLEATVHLRGSTNDVAAQLQQAHIFVLPSTNEPCSVALLEALAQGLPALVSDSGGNVDIVRHGQTGWHFQADKLHSLSSSLESITQNSAPQFSPVEIRDSIRRYSASQVSSDYLKVYRGLTRSG